MNLPKYFENAICISGGYLAVVSTFRYEPA